MADAKGREVDLHPTTFDEAGNGIYRMENGKDYVFTSRAFSGSGMIDNVPVRCLSAEQQVRDHTGYKLHESDFLDMALLHERFGVELPAEYQR